ncbi:MAG: YceD family protein [Gammaproteobacteria bacterium]|nr:MAG: YceD family protein [Gammaproteobacteria bacterium]
MLDCLPEYIEPVGLADAGRSFRGEVPVSELMRLRPSLSRADGRLKVALEFHVDERRVRTLSGCVEGSVDLVCQRCLETLMFPLDVDFKLGIISSDEEISRLPDGYEPLLVTGEPLRTFDVIEDEVLLAIPVIPLHEGVDGCKSGYVNQPAAEKENPFSVLKKLKI